MALEKPSSKQVQILAVGSGLERAGVAGRNLGEALTASATIANKNGLIDIYRTLFSSVQFSHSVVSNSL